MGVQWREKRNHQVKTKLVYDQFKSLPVKLMTVNKQARKVAGSATCEKKKKQYEIVLSFNGCLSSLLRYLKSVSD